MKPLSWPSKFIIGCRSWACNFLREGKSEGKVGQWVRVQTYSDRMSAEAAKNYLEVYGITATLSADDAGGTRPELTLARGVKLWVKEEDQQDARELLESAAIPPSGSEDSVMEKGLENPSRGFLTRLRKWLRGA